VNIPPKSGTYEVSHDHQMTSNIEINAYAHEKHKMTIFELLSHNYEIYFIIMTFFYASRKISEEQIVATLYVRPSQKNGFICWRHKWRDLVYEYSWAKSPMISGYEWHVAGRWFSPSTPGFLQYKTYRQIHLSTFEKMLFTMKCRG
jgi:hypothetical protein